jgi:predicted NAD-dependent protein-ADP-ribosyltransferase YbiA (DUF1768 family)
MDTEDEFYDDYDDQGYDDRDLELEQFYHDEENIDRTMAENERKRYQQIYTREEAPLTHQEKEVYERNKNELYLSKQRHEKQQRESEKLQAEIQVKTQEADRIKKSGELSSYKKKRPISQLAPLGTPFEYEDMIREKRELNKRQELRGISQLSKLGVARRNTKRGKTKEGKKNDTKYQKALLRDKKKKELYEQQQSDKRTQKRIEQKQRKEQRVVEVIPRIDTVEQPVIELSEEDEDEISPELQQRLREVDIVYEKKPVRKSRWGPELALSPVAKKNKTISLAEFKHVDLNPNCGTIFRFFSKSKHVDPGEGVGEKRETGVLFGRLKKINDWRKKLSNFWKSDFTLDGKRWKSVEHYFQSRKFDNNPEFADQFSLDSGSELSDNPVMAKFVGGKSGKFKKKQIRPLNVHIVPNFYNKQNYYNVMSLASYAKFTQSIHLGILLDDTKDACLYHIVGRGSPDIRFTWLEKIRECMRILKEQNIYFPKLTRTDL